ncbi:Mbeg1-like protein [Lysinibacillus halotolerans]|uniref:DUF2974 domain-containing protein n=1 Tax=Lysinibacillus halotolerans TaxID=1368476 RepID=A0A3M8HBQ9_9BACI|nr:Mbeg1-like protein [Lysinibacillus halotolerans]RNC99806.1 DUF2974 domain-containing protein [Lysinibacillus halotolerans]
MALTDYEKKIVTDIAYQDLVYFKKETAEESNNVMDQINLMISEGKNFKGETLSDEKIEELTRVKNRLTEIGAEDWKVSYVQNHNEPEQSGFYGVLIDTGEEYTAGFRGSENPGELGNAKNDWYEADLKLVTDIQTKQQQQVEVFLSNLNEKVNLDKYGELEFAGHSLGGNLAVHAAIMAEQYEKINNFNIAGYNLDGPGYSSDYIAKHQERIQYLAENGKVEHYQWSIVGAILIPIVERQTLKTEGKDSGSLIAEHSTDTLDFNGDQFVIGKQEQKESIMASVTSFVDKLPTVSKNLLIDTLGGMLVAAIWTKEKIFNDQGLTNFGKGLIAGAIVIVGGALLVAGPAAVLAAVGTIIAGVVQIAIRAAIAFIGVVLVETIAEFTINMIKGIANQIGEAVQWTGKQIASVIDSAIDFINKAGGFLQNLFGITKAVATPYIQLDTNSLRNYANRLSKVKSRLAELDSDMTSLIFSESLPAVISAIKANNFPSQRKVQQCINYLDGTADAFEKAEKNILSRV